MPMPRPTFLTAGLVLGAGLMWSLSVAFGTTPWTEGASAIIGADLILVTAIAVVALLLSPGRWVKNLITALGVVWAGLAVAIDVDILWSAGLTLSVIGLALVWSRPMDTWLIGNTRPDRVPPKATILTLALIATPGMVGAAGFPDVTAGGWALAGVCAAIGWVYSRAIPAALWAVRLGLWILGIAAVLGLDPIAAAGLLLWVGAVVALGWTSDARLAASPLFPRKVEAVSILPEMVPADLMESAGLDRKGEPQVGGGA